MSPRSLSKKVNPGFATVLPHHSEIPTKFVSVHTQTTNAKHQISQYKYCLSKSITIHENDLCKVHKLCKSHKSQSVEFKNSWSAPSSGYDVNQQFLFELPIASSQRIVTREVASWIRGVIADAF